MGTPKAWQATRVTGEVTILPKSVILSAVRRMPNEVERPRVSFYWLRAVRTFSPHTFGSKSEVSDAHLHDLLSRKEAKS